MELYQSHRASADRDPTLGEAVCKAWSDAQAYALSAYHTVGRLNRGAQIGAESSINKIIWSELDLRMHETAMRILGAGGELMNSLHDGHDWLEGFLCAQAGPIYAGTNEIQRNIIAERMLGLPK